MCLSSKLAALFFIREKNSSVRLLEAPNSYSSYSVSSVVACEAFSLSIFCHPFPFVNPNFFQMGRFALVTEEKKRQFQTKFLSDGLQWEEHSGSDDPGSARVGRRYIPNLYFLLLPSRIEGSVRPSTSRFSP